MFQKFSGHLFYRTTTVAAFKVSFSIRKEFKKKKVSEEIAITLISLVLVQIQEPASRLIITKEHLSFLQNLLNFIIEKYENLSVCVDERSLCGLSITRVIKIYQCHEIKKVMTFLLPMEKCRMYFYQGVIFTAEVS